MKTELALRSDVRGLPLALASDDQGQLNVAMVNFCTLMYYTNCCHPILSRWHRLLRTILP